MDLPSELHAEQVLDLFIVREGAGRRRFVRKEDGYFGKVLAERRGVAVVRQREEEGRRARFGDVREVRRSDRGKGGANMNIFGQFTFFFEFLSGKHSFLAEEGAFCARNGRIDLFGFDVALGDAYAFLYEGGIRQHHLPASAAARPAAFIVEPQLHAEVTRLFHRMAIGVKVPFGEIFGLHGGGEGCRTETLWHREDV